MLNLGSDDAPHDDGRRRLRRHPGAQRALLLAAQDDGRQERPHAAQDVAEFRREARIRVERLDHQRHDEAAMVRDGGVEEAGVDHLAQPCERVRCRRHLHLLQHVLLEAADAVLHGLEEELFLVAEVVVDGALGDAGIARDAVDGRALVAEAREAIDRRRHELLPRRLGPLGPRLAATPSADLERLREERAIKRRLADIEAFYAAVRARQRARLEAYANSTLLSDWEVADRWLQLKDEEGRLRADLARLARRGPES